MTQYIDKDALVAKIKRRFDECSSSILKHYDACKEAKALELGKILTIIDTLEVKEVDTWHLQEKEDIYDAVKGWSLQTFVCIMKDGTIQRFNGYFDEDCEGHIHAHIDGVNDDYDNVDDIEKWKDITKEME